MPTNPMPPPRKVPRKPVPPIKPGGSGPFVPPGSGTIGGRKFPPKPPKSNSMAKAAAQKLKSMYGNK